MKTKIPLSLKLIFLLVFGGIFSGCTAELQRAKEMYDKATEIGKVAADKYEDMDAMLSEAEKLEPMLLEKLDKDMDGKLSQIEIQSPDVLLMVMDTYYKHGWKGVLILLLGIFVLFQGNHIFEWRKKLKQYGGGWLKSVFGGKEKPDKLE